MWKPEICLLESLMKQSAMAFASLIVGTTLPPLALLTLMRLSAKRSGCATLLHLVLPASAIRKPSVVLIAGDLLPENWSNYSASLVGCWSSSQAGNDSSSLGRRTVARLPFELRRRKALTTVLNHS